MRCSGPGPSSCGSRHFYKGVVAEGVVTMGVVAKGIAAMGVVTMGEAGVVMRRPSPSCA
ncbi:hypothetical protein K9U14_11440 [Streptomyces griseocarneus]|nr:hypothetical protein [Streptomyces griseocarneus]